MTDGGHVLVVDDDAAILEMVTQVLDFEGIAFEKAANGVEALAAIERSRPAVILLDMRMPVMDGWTFARELKARGIELPIVVMTAAQDARRWAQDVDAVGHVAKPFDLDELLRAVQARLVA